MTAAELWAGYKASTPGARDRLIVHYTPLVKSVASRASAGLHVEQADLVSYGIFGLIDAIEKFDPERGIRFEPYAIARIKGAIIDELRAVDWVPRSVRAKVRAADMARGRLEAGLLRTPTNVELAAELGVTEAEMHIIVNQASMVDVPKSMSGAGDDDMGLEEVIPDGRRTADGYEGLEVEELKQLVAEAISQLSDREKLVLTLYYQEGLTFGEISVVLGVTATRVCQIHTKSVLQLRSPFQPAQNGR